MSDLNPRCMIVSRLDDAQLTGLGPAHPSLGGLMDYGTYARVTGKTWTGPELERWLTAQLQGTAVAICHVDALAVPTHELRGLLEEGIFEQQAAVWAIGSGGSALFVVAGPGVPIFGSRPPCPLATTVHTVRWLAGALSETSQTLFTEPGDVEDEGLDERLRRLYGE